jgi:hypothetical protein
MLLSIREKKNHFIGTISKTAIAEQQSEKPFHEKMLKHWIKWKSGQHSFWQNIYSLRPLLPILIRMYLVTRMCPNTFVLGQVIVVGGSIYIYGNCLQKIHVLLQLHINRKLPIDHLIWRKATWLEKLNEKASTKCCTLIYFLLVLARH